MKPKIKNQQIIELMDKAEEARIRLGLSREALRDILNADYLHKGNSISSQTVHMWLLNKSSRASGESVLAIQRWVADNKQKTTP